MYIFSYTRVSLIIKAAHHCFSFGTTEYTKLVCAIKYVIGRIIHLCCASRSAKHHQVWTKIFSPDLGHSFFCFSLTRASCMRPAGKKTKKTHWAREGAVFGYQWTREDALHARHTAKNTHWTREGAVLSTTEHERVPYTHATRCTQRGKSTYTHWKNVRRSVFY